jgi:hypothetical protein
VGLVGAGPDGLEVARAFHGKEKSKYGEYDWKAIMYCGVAQRNWANQKGLLEVPRAVLVRKPFNAPPPPSWYRPINVKMTNNTSATHLWGVYSKLRLPWRWNSIADDDRQPS